MMPSSLRILRDVRLRGWAYQGVLSWDEAAQGVKAKTLRVCWVGTSYGWGAQYPLPSHALSPQLLCRVDAMLDFVWSFRGAAMAQLGALRVKC